MPSIPFPKLLVHAVLALLLAVNGVGPALAAGTMHHAAPSASEAMSHAMPMPVADADCHDAAPAQAPDAADPAPCCDDGSCDLAGCECACLAVAAALPLPAADAPAFVPAARPERVFARAHAPPPRGAVIRPPIA